MNKKYLYFDLSSGVAGDMLLGALIDLKDNGEKINDLKEELGLEADIAIRSDSDNEIKGKNVEIKSETNESRHLADIKRLLDQSSLGHELVLKSKKVFSDLAEVEAEIHDSNPEDIHFHEVGAVDSILDIVGVLAFIDEISPNKVFASKINVGRGGYINCAHGRIPNPAPATVRLLKKIPIYSTVEGDETATPTGVVLMKNIVDEFDRFPSMRIEKVGRGIGDKHLPIPDMVTAILGES